MGSGQTSDLPLLPPGGWTSRLRDTGGRTWLPQATEQLLQELTSAPGGKTATNHQTRPDTKGKGIDTSLKGQKRLKTFPNNCPEAAVGGTGGRVVEEKQQGLRGGASARCVFSRSWRPCRPRVRASEVGGWWGHHGGSLSPSTAAPS